MRKGTAPKIGVGALLAAPHCKERNSVKPSPQSARYSAKSNKSKALPVPDTKKTRALTTAQQAKMQHLQTILGYVVVGVSALGAIILTATRQLPVPVGIGLVLLVALRLYALKRELKKQGAEEARIS